MAYALGYAFGCCATALAAASLMLVTLSTNTQFAAVVLVTISSFSFVFGTIPGGLCGISKKLRSKIENRWAKFGVSAGYLVGIGIVCGVIVGAGMSVLVLVPSDAIKLVGTEVLIFIGPFGGMWWVLRFRPAPPDPDYDDAMTAPPLPHPNRHIDLPDLVATEAFGRRLGELLFPNAVIALVGPLGAGKTHLTRAVAEGLGISNPAAVTSPTFTLVHEYPARLPIYHFDAYRLNGPDEFLDLGVTEYYEAGGVCLIEWADKVEAALPAERLTIRLRPINENRREAEVVPTGERYVKLAEALVERPE